MCMVNEKFGIQGLWIGLEVVFVLGFCTVLSMCSALNTIQY